MRIAVDAMGGDNAPQAIVEGVLLASKDFPTIEFQLYGKESEIKKYLTNDQSNIKIIHTDEKINSDDEPVRAIRRKKQASMVLAAQAVKNGEADAIFSAGNTGALLAAGLLIVGRIKGIERPGLLSTMPMIGSDTGFDLLDLGANADNKPEHLVQYGILGSFYAQNVRGIKKPRVGLLNNGTEETKGSELTKKTFELLSQEESIHFIGNVEARDILTGVADVVVTDGFTGNAVLKSIEGTALNIVSLLKKSILDSGLKGKIGALLLKDALKNLKDEMDYAKYGGAVLFGLKAPVVKTHGSTGPEAVATTIRQIHTMLESQVVAHLVEKFEPKSQD